MKKVVVLLLVLIMAMSVYAETIKDGVYDSTAEDVTFASGDGAKLPVSLIVGGAGDEKVVVGFASNDITAIDTTPTPVTAATLTPVTSADGSGHAVGTAYLKDQNIYMFYQIQSPNTLYVNVSTTALSGTGGSLDWKVSNADGETTSFSIGGTDGDITYSTTDPLYTHKGSTDKFAAVDSIKLAMETASYTDLPAATYSADLQILVTTGN